MNPEVIREIEGNRKRLLVFVLNVVRDRETAQDIVQDTVLALLRAEEDGRLPDRPVAWMMRVARNKALDVLKSAAVRGNSGMASDQVRVVSESLEGMVSARDRVRQVETVLRTLPEQQRSVFVLRDVLGYEMDEIGRILDCSEANVRQLLSRARKRIREYLSKNQ